MASPITLVLTHSTTTNAAETENIATSTSATNESDFITGAPIQALLLSLVLGCSEQSSSAQKVGERSWFEKLYVYEPTDKADLTSIDQVVYHQAPTAAAHAEY